MADHPAPAPTAAKLVSPRTAIADLVIEDVLELDPTDYPDDDPDTLRMSLPDLRRIVERHAGAVISAALASAEPERGAVGISAERRKEITISTEAYYRALALERGEIAALKTAIDDLAKTHAALEDAERETATLTERLARARDAWDAWAEHHERCYACSTMRCEDAAEYRNRLDAALRAAAGGKAE